MSSEILGAFEEAVQKALVPADLRAKGWRYFDPPTRFSPEMWDYFLHLIGEGEYRIIVQSDWIGRDGLKWRRGQLLISPQGMVNMTDKERRKELATPPPLPSTPGRE